jgi:ABC-type transport system involved in cytochrome c biogenesis permease subunit
MPPIELEGIALWAAIIGNSVACATALFALFFRKKPERFILALITVSWLLHTLAIGMRWHRVGHLPVGNMFEMLSANVWGLMAAVVAGYWLLPRMRAFAALVLPLVVLVMGWMMLPPWEATTLPPSYNTVWLFIHIGFIKLFLGAAVVALGLGGIVLLRLAAFGRDRLANLPANPVLDETAYRCMALALIFDSVGIVAGAIWAHSAWGRYWSWDRLEVWSLVTWLSIGLMLHLRASYKTPPVINAMLVAATFVIAFLTFFGIPFVSRALHQGAF